MANECACGCGEFLPDGSTRQYKRGHRTRSAVVISDPPEDYDSESPLTIQDAAELIEDDPAPPLDEVKPEPPPVRITKTVRKDIEGKVAFMLSMGASAWSMSDPMCGGVLMQQSPDIALRLTPIICQSPEIVKWFRRGGNFMLYVDLFMVMLPVLQVIFAHHVAKSMELPGESDDYSQYAAA